MYYYDSTYILVLIGFLLSMAAEGAVRLAYSKWDDVQSRTGLTGRDIARRILDAGGLQDVPIQMIPGELTDNYDSGSRVLSLSQAVYQTDSVASIGIAAHECGHALQDAQNYMPLRIRSNLVPIASVGSRAAIPLFLAGLFFFFRPLQMIGICCFLFAVLFYLVTLPVEFDASRRAIQILSAGVVPEDEMAGVKSVLNAAAMTYVASALQAMLQMARLILLSQKRRRD